MPITSLTNTASIQAQREYKNQLDKTTTAMERLSSGSKLVSASDDPASRTIATDIRKSIGIGEAVIKNMDSGESLTEVVANSYDKILDKLVRLRALSSQASSTTLSPKLRQQINLEFQQGIQFVNEKAASTIFNGKTLLSGGASTASQHGAEAASAVGIVDVTGTHANTFIAAPFAVASSFGFHTGAVSAASVKGAPGNYDLTMTIGGQEFSAKGFTQAASAVINLTSANGSRVGFTLGADISGITSAATFDAAFKAALGLTLGNAPASFESVRTANNNGTNGITISGSPEAGEYALWSIAGSNEIVLSNGKDTFRASVTADGAQTVNFGNGVTLALDGTYARATAITNIGFSVLPDAANQSVVTLQSNTLGATISSRISGATAATLGISGLTVATEGGATAAGSILEEAITKVAGYIAEIGAFQGRLKDTRDSLQSDIDTNQKAFSRLNDADILGELTIQNQGMVAQQIALNTNNKGKELTDFLLQSVRA